MRRGRPPYPDLLTPREQEVLALIREGLTNDQIATRLGISESGARYHVSEILSKLNVSSRREAAQWDGPERRGPTFGVVVDYLRRAIAHPSGAFVLSAAVGVLVLLGAGIAIVRARGGEESPGHSFSSTTEFRDLIAEATGEAQAKVPGAVLIQVSYGLASGGYTFHMIDPSSRREVQVIGPEDHPGLSRWLVFVDLDPQTAGLPIPPAFGAADVHQGPEEVVQLADSRVGPLADGVAVLRNDMTKSPTGVLTWTVRGAGAVAPQCVLEDAAPASAMVCVSP